MSELDELNLIMECEWKFIDDEKPNRDGVFTILWSEPYSSEMSLGQGYFNKSQGRFDSETAGANEVIFWLDGIEFPDLPREGLRTRRVVRD